MKKNNGFIKRRIIAIALSVITVTSFATMSFTTASAAKTTSTISAVVNKNTHSLLSNSTKSQKQAIKDIKAIKQSIEEYKEKSAQEAKEAKIKKRKDTIEKYATSGLEAVNNIVKGEYVSAVKSVVNLLPYGGVINGVIDLFTSLYSPDSGEPELVPKVSLEEIKEQLDNIETSINSLKEAVKQNENNEFYKCLNQIVLVYNSKGSVIKQYIEDKAELLNAKNILEAAKQEKDAEKISKAEEEFKKADDELKESQKLIDNFFGDDYINDFYKLQENLRQCTQYMNGTSFSLKDNKEEGNPFLINFKSKINGASAGTSIDSIIEQCIEENKEIWNYYELGITMYSALAPSYINYLNERGQTDKANANTQEYVSFMTGVYPSKSQKTAYNKINATDVHDYYIATIIPKMLESSGMYKFKDGTIGEKAAEVTCNGTTEYFKSFDEAWNYATQYTNTKITFCKDAEISEILRTSEEHKNNIELDLQGHTINTKGTLVLKNGGSLTIYSSIGNGTFKNSGAITCILNENGALKVENCIFEKYSLSAIRNYGGNADINNCIFKNNSARYGGAIDSHADFTIKNCTFESNESERHGGAITSFGGKNYIENCTFNNNKAGLNGGAIFYTDSLSAPTIRRSTFTNNYARENGGAIFVSEHTDFDISYSNLINNKCGKNGGAIFLGQLRSTNHYFRNMTIEYNKCGNEGGGVYANACGCNTADIKLFGWNKIRYNANIYGSSSNAKMIKSAARTVFKIMDDFDPYNSVISGTTDSDGSCMVFLNSSSKYTYCCNYTTQARAFRADYGSLKQSGSNIYWSK